MKLQYIELINKKGIAYRGNVLIENGRSKSVLKYNNVVPKGYEIMPEEPITWVTDLTPVKASLQAKAFNQAGEFNTDMLNKAEAIRCIRTQSLINEEFGFLDKHDRKPDFLAYFEKMTHKKDDKWTCVYKHFFKFVQGHCTFGDVTVELCKKFREYLLNANQLNRTKQKVSLNSAAGYYSTFRGLLKIAYRDKWLRENINDYLDKIEPQDVKKEFLTLDEVKQLAATPCDIPVLKSASLFACLTGLRISDILKIALGRLRDSSRPRLLLAYSYPEDSDRGNLTYQQRGIRTMW